ncbi:UNVERIFIED_CONTAM: hypothetical protein Sradi_1992400 [Sesamum radiatum]|uniref:Uncharacterized protein n=1 Tax=Sesamum radiatum TaxID=300843 RepID=A0AAW2TIZ1_SESRA
MIASNGRPGHWARDCPSAGGGRGARPFSPPRSRYGGAGARGIAMQQSIVIDMRMIDTTGVVMVIEIDEIRMIDMGAVIDMLTTGHLPFPVRSSNFAQYPPPPGDRFPVDRYGASDRYPHNGYGKDRAYDRDGGPRGSSDRYGGGAGVGPARYEGRSYRGSLAPMTALGGEGDPLPWNAIEKSYVFSAIQQNPAVILTNEIWMLIFSTVADNRVEPRDINGVSPKPRIPSVKKLLDPIKASKPPNRGPSLSHIAI